MKIVTITPLTVSVELDIADCIALCDACMYRADDWDAGNASTLLKALGMGLLGSAFAAYDADGDEHPTIRQMWEVWAPIVCVGAHDYRRMPVPKEYAEQRGFED